MFIRVTIDLDKAKEQFDTDLGVVVTGLHGPYRAVGGGLITQPVVS